jgi:virginiamycin A acetyltransferase
MRGAIPKLYALVPRPLRRVVARFRNYDRVMVERHVQIASCELIAPVEVGFRSYANGSLIRDAVIGRFCSIGRRCSIGAYKIR